MTYDPFQTNATFGAYTGAGNPFNSPLTAMQTSAINPSLFNQGAFNQGTSWNPLNGYQGVPQSIYPQPGSPQWSQAGQGGYAQPALWQNPLLLAGLQQGGFQNGITHNPLAQQLAVQQLAAQQIMQHIIAQHAQQAAAQQLAALGQQNGFYYGPSGGQSGGQNGQIGVNGQQGLPFGQNVSPFGQLAPQSWVGQQTGQMGGQANAVLLAQMTARALQAQGFPV
jgi:hypothetical protein